MIKYKCTKCEIDVETSICPICKERTEAKSKIYWCKECKIPLYNEKCPICFSDTSYLATDIRPVFPEERLLIETIIGQPLKFIKDSVWHSNQRYYVNGKSLNISVKMYKDLNVADVIQTMEKFQNENNDQAYKFYVERFVKANQHRYDQMTSEAIEAIRTSSEGYTKEEMFVSFSGGKDSTVTSHLVMSAFGDPSYIHIFGDTTLEFPETMEYMKRFREVNNRTPVITARNRDKDFFDMCDVVGPPSRVMRWCCTIFKTGAITKTIQGTFTDKKNLLTFYGVRRSESASRKTYERDTESPKIAKQRVMSPIIDWMDFDVWLYLLTTKVDFNTAYRFGYSRVGCWCCPNNGEWSQFLSKIYMTEEFTRFRNQLVKFAIKIGKPDPEVYVDGGWWKARQGGNGLDISENIFIEFKPCATSSNSFNYELNKIITEDFYELFKPFGWLDFEKGNPRLGEFYVTNRKGETVLIVQARKGSNSVKVTIEKLPLLGAKSVYDAEKKIKCQLTKFQMCLGCLACESACKHNAISIKNKGDETYSYRINDKKCIRCGDCVGHFDGGCYMRKVIMTKRGD